jgi:hypothetical protein
MRVDFVHCAMHMHELQYTALHHSTVLRSVISDRNTLLYVRSGADATPLWLHCTHTLQLGLLAQEVEAVLPLLVGKDSEGCSTVAYSRLTPVLVEAVKELDAQNSELAARLSAAESRLQQLEAVVQLLLKDATAAAATSS